MTNTKSKPCSFNRVQRDRHKDFPCVDIRSIIITIRTYRCTKSRSVKSCIQCSFASEQIMTLDARKLRVLIVGAGASGLAAASRLHQKGVTDFAVLEAANRIGGRIHR